MTKLTTIVLMAAMVFSFVAGFSQTDFEGEPTTYLKRNSVQGTGGLILLGASASGYYERIIGKKDLTLFSRVGIGTLAFWGVFGDFVMAEGGILTHAKSKHHLEAALGANYFYNSDYHKVVMPSLSADSGIRNQEVILFSESALDIFRGFMKGVGYNF